MATSDRWAPWIEPRVGMTGGAITINSATPVAVPGCTVTFTPHVNCRVAVPFAAYATMAVDGGTFLIVRCLLNGAPAAGIIPWEPRVVNAAAILAQTCHFDLTAGTTYTISLDAAVGGAGSSFGLQPTHTGLGPIVGIPNLHS